MECKNDKDCLKTEMCSLDEVTLKQTCVSSSPQTMYYGCASTDSLGDPLIKTGADTSFQECIDFTRRQLNKDGFEYNFMIYRPKTKVFVDLTNIIIYLKCGEEILSAIPYGDYFTLECDASQERCVLRPKEGLAQFIYQNALRSNMNDVYLEITYQCENESVSKTDRVPPHFASHALTCPVQTNDDAYRIKCSALFYEGDVSTRVDPSASVDTRVDMPNCKTNPLFKIPVITNDVSKYEKKRRHRNKELIHSYNAEIEHKIDDLKRLEAEKYIRLVKFQKGTDISMDEAMRVINARPLNTIVQTDKDDWKVFRNMDAAQSLLYKENEKNKVLEYYGKVYTLNDAIQAANENNQSFFVWYHNSYELDEFASKLYFIDIYFSDSELLQKRNWTHYDNVSTCILKDYVEKEDGTDDVPSVVDVHELKEIFEDSTGNTAKISDILTKSMINMRSINNAVIKGLNNKITTYGQMITMNNYEGDILSKIIMGMTIVFILLFFIGIGIGIKLFYVKVSN